MRRIAESALMNDPAQAAAYSGPYLADASRLFVHYFRKCFSGLAMKGAILDLGCGPAAIPCRLAQMYPDCEIHGVDGAPHMLSRGREAVQRDRLERQVHLFQGTLPDRLPLPRDRYEAIISNSLLHHLADPMILWQALPNYAMPHAAVLIIDLVRPASVERARYIVDSYLTDAPALLRQDMLHSLCAAYTLDEVADQLESTGLGDTLTLTMASPFQFAAYGYLQ